MGEALGYMAPGERTRLAEELRIERERSDKLAGELEWYESLLDRMERRIPEIGAVKKFEEQKDDLVDELNKEKKLRDERQAELDRVRQQLEQERRVLAQLKPAVGEGSADSPEAVARLEMELESVLAEEFESEKGEISKALEEEKKKEEELKKELRSIKAKLMATQASLRISQQRVQAADAPKAEGPGMDKAELEGKLEAERKARETLEVEVKRLRGQIRGYTSMLAQRRRF